MVKPEGFHVLWMSVGNGGGISKVGRVKERESKEDGSMLHLYTWKQHNDTHQTLKRGEKKRKGNIMEEWTCSKYTVHV
jgi:hypothetical protein